MIAVRLERVLPRPEDLTVGGLQADDRALVPLSDFAGQEQLAAFIEVGGEGGLIVRDQCVLCSVTGELHDNIVTIEGIR